MPSSETPQFPPAYECPGCPEVCQNGTLMATGRVGRVYGGCMEGVWRGNGGGTVGEGRGPGGFEDHLQCAILAHNPLLVSNVNQQSIPQQPLLAHDQSCDSLSHPSRSSANSTRSSRKPDARVGDLPAVGQLPQAEGVFHHKWPQCQSICCQ